MNYTFTSIDGCRVEVNVAAAFQRMAADFLRDTGCSLHVRDGSRTREEQAALYQNYLNGGTLAAPPGQSNHEIDGPNGPRSLDLYDSGDDAGVTVFGTARDGWMQRNAGNYGFENEGNNFGEPWHKTFRGDIGGGSAALDGNQRRAGSNGVRARREPNTSSEAVDASFLAEGEVGTFAGYVTGENVDGENRWAKGAFSGLFFWLGGLTPQGVDRLPLLDAPKPTLRADQRQADSDGVKGRADATTQAPQTTYLEPNDVGDFNGWKHGENVSGEDRWLRGAYSGAWFWLGGLSPKNVDGLTEVKGSTTPPVTPPVTPPGRTKDDPAVPGTFTGQWSANCEKRTGNAGNYFIVHHAADPRPADAQLQRFMNPNDRDVSCTWFVDGATAYKVVHPDDRQWTTGRIIDQQALAVETRNTSGAPAWGISDESHETIAQLVAWWAKNLGGIVDRQHVLGHAEARAKLDMTIPATACPGPSMDVGRIVKRALEILSPVVAPDPDTVPVDHSWLQQLFDKLKTILGK